MPTPLTFKALSKIVYIMTMDRRIGTIRYDFANIGWQAELDTGEKTGYYSTWQAAAYVIEEIYEGK